MSTEIKAHARRFWWWIVWRRYYAADGAPRRCRFCGSTAMKVTGMGRVANVVSEEAHLCATCDKEIGYWAYGAFDPGYMQGAV